MGGFQHRAWQLHWMAVEKLWFGTGWAFLSFLTQMGIDKAPVPFYGLHFWHCRQLSVGRSIHRSEGPDHYKLANEWVWQRS